jgi:DNA-directed RNA polymerase subunit RPC12/RpoP
MRQEYKCKDCKAIILGEIGRRTVKCRKCGGKAVNMGPGHQRMPVM